MPSELDDAEDVYDRRALTLVTSTILNTDVRDNLLALPHIYDYSATDVDVVSSAAEISVWSKAISGGAMGVNGRLDLALEGDVLHNNAAGNTCTVRIKFGGTTLFEDSTNFGGVLGASRQPWLLRIWLSNRAATNAQFMFGVAHMTVADTAAPTTGIGSLEVTGTARGASTFASSAPHAIDTTADQTFEVTAQWNASSANNSFRKRMAVLYLGQN